ncbi:MAG: glycosyltransferase [Cyanobacteria bacterium RM1_2_2]|nr:glycosyltransferase [Cyanobacteria bacterium RM1_2_2]
MPKVSIVLPSYNYARYLDERIQSLLNQTYTDFELLIVDDASTDNSVEVINQYVHDSRVRTHFFEQNSGLPYKRWNDGADLAQGEYILFAGADDSCEPTLIEKLVEKLEQNPTVGIAYCQSMQMDSDGKVGRSLKNRTDELDRNRWAQDFVNNGQDECQYLVIKNTIPNASAALLRRSTFETAGQFDVNLRLVADWMLWAKMLMISDIAFVAEPLNYFRLHAMTVTSNTRKIGKHVEENYQVISFITNSVALPQKSIDKAYTRLVNRWVNSILKLAIRQPSEVMSKARMFYSIASQQDKQVNRRLFERAMKDVFTLGFLSFRERAAQQ